MGHDVKRIHTVVGLTITLDLMGLGLILPLKPFFAESFGASAVEVTLLTACFAVAQLVFAPLWGRASNRFGRRPVILTSVALNGAAYLLFAAAESLSVLFIARALAGLASASVPAAQAVIADTTTAGHRTGGMGIVGAAFGIGFVIGPTLGAALAQLDPTAPALAAAGLALVNLLLAARWLPETRSEQTASSPAPSEKVANMPLPSAFWQLVALLTLTKAAMALTEQCAGLLVEQRWTDPVAPGAAIADAAALTGVVLVTVGIVAVLVQGLVVGAVARRFGERTLVGAGAAIAALAMTLVPVATDGGGFWVLVVAFGLCAVGTSLLLPAAMAALSATVASGQVGHAMGVAQGISGIGRVIGPLCAGWLFEADALAPFVVAAALFAAVPAALNLSGAPAESAVTSATEAA